jgi:hypothetical protein
MKDICFRETQPRALSMDIPTPFETARRRLRLISVTLERRPGEDMEYRVKPTGAPETAWETFVGLPEAEARGLAMAPKPAVPPTGKRRPRVYRSYKAKMRAERKAHNRRMRARLLRGITSAGSS